MDKILICAETTKCLLNVKLIKERLQNYTHSLRVLKDINKKLEQITEEL